MRVGRRVQNGGESDSMPTYALPSKVFSYVRRLLLNYEHSGPRELAALIKHARIAVDPDTDRYYDFGSENYGHNVVFFLPSETIAPISLKQQAAVADRIKEDLVECSKGISHEYI